MENTRVGQITDYDKLTLEVWTDGTINAKEAVSLAARVLTEHLNLFVNLSEEAMGAEIMVEKDDKGKEKALEIDVYKRQVLSCEFLCAPPRAGSARRGRRQGVSHLNICEANASQLSEQKRNEEP